MKGFLRRTLESARGAELRLKPLTGSVYKGDHRRPEFLQGNWREETAYTPPTPAAPPSRQPSQAGTSQAASLAAPEILLPVRSEPQESASRGRRNSSESERPLPVAHSPGASSAAPADLQSTVRPASQRETRQALAQSPTPVHPGSLSLHSGLQANKPSHTESAVPPAPQQTSSPEKIRQSENPRRSASALTPRPDPQQIDLPRVDPFLRAAVAAKPPAPSPPLSLPRNRTQQEPQVQVHIGRIEVIAAVPQPPRVPTPRPNRATSLADYLAGRNGRSL
jgi:hypothetical protein